MGYNELNPGLPGDQLLGQRLTLNRGVLSMWRYQSSVTEIQVPAHLSECYKLRKIVSFLASGLLHNPHDIADVQLAVGEAFTNAVKYGIGNAKVCVKVDSSSNRELAVELKYRGREFDTTVTCPEEPTHTGGYGRFLMKNVTDGMRYRFRDGDTIVRLVKRR